MFGKRRQQKERQAFEAAVTEHLRPVEVEPGVHALDLGSFRGWRWYSITVTGDRTPHEISPNRIDPCMCGHKVMYIKQPDINSGRPFLMCQNGRHILAMANWNHDPIGVIEDD